MTEQLISFETSKLAKEKGFKQEISPCFADDGNIHTWAYFAVSKPDANSYFQTTQPILQRWLREVHNLHIYVEPIWETENDLDKNPSYIPWVITGIEEPPVYLDTYESALESALQEALQLINP